MTGLWQQLVLFEKGKKDVDGCKLAPQTCAILEAHMKQSAVECQRGQIKFSVMHPGIHVKPHTGRVTRAFKKKICEKLGENCGKEQKNSCNRIQFIGFLLQNILDLKF